MFLLLNGSFGIGKTTTAQLLVRQWPEATISDPEQIGYVLRRLPAWMLGLPRQPPDYQDMALWRRLIVLQARWAHRGASTVIIPMAFTNLDYLDSFASALEKTAPVCRVCLVAPLAVVQQRLMERAVREGRAGLTAFEETRSLACVEAHADRAYGVPIDATAEPAAIVAAIRAEMARR